MGRELRVTNQAARDLASIAERQRTIESVEVAQSTMRAISRSIKNLVFTPLGSPWCEKTGARERLAAGYMIVYDVEPVSGIGPCAGDVTVLHIFNPAPDQHMCRNLCDAGDAHQKIEDAIASIPHGVYVE